MPDQAIEDPTWWCGTCSVLNLGPAFRNAIHSLARRMHMKHVLSVLAFGLSTLSVVAQEPTLCGTDQMRLRMIAEDPTYLEREAQLEQEIRALLQSNAVQRDDNFVYVIPVVFHILHLNGDENISNEQVFNAMNILNRDFAKLNADTAQVDPVFRPLIADAKIQFRLATKDPYGNCTLGINRIQTSETFIGESTSKLNPWPRSQYLNIWVSRGIISGAAGYFTSGGPGLGSLLDGVMILHDYVGDGSSNGTGSLGRSRALTHEVGHYLSLAHVWGTNNGLPENAPACHMVPECGDDGVEDTPLTRGWSCCPAIGQRADCDPEIPENVDNYMEYSYCSKMFTYGQVDRMRAALNSSSLERDLLWTETNLFLTGVAPGSEITCAPEADFYAQVGTNPSNPTVPFTPTACTGATVRFVDNSTRAVPTSWSWTFQDGNPATSNQRNPNVTFSSPGWKTVSLTVSNDNGSSTKTEEFAVLIGSNESAMGAFFESFESQQGDNLFPYFAMNYDNNHTSFRRYTGGGHTGSACAMLNSGDRNQLDLLDPNNENDIDELVTPLVNLSGVGSAVLAFRWSYSTMTNTPEEITEKLQVFRSTDCGRTWTQLPGELDGTDLVTSGNDAQMPPTQWQLKTITLPGSVLTNNVRFRFRFTSGTFSNNLFIDDINIATPVGIIDLMQDGMVNVFPNPTNDHFTLQVLGMEDERTEIVITDLRGAVVYSNVFQPKGGANIELSARGMGLAEGVYMLRASNSLGRSTQKLVVGR